MPRFRVMDRNGDTETSWDKSDPDKVKEAEALFATLVKTRKHVAHVPSGDGSPGTLLKKFDPDAEETIFNPPLIGG